jgi:pilus assembly protein CpaE
VSRLDSVADTLIDQLQKSDDYYLTKKVISNGHTDPMHDVRSKPDVLLLHYIPGYGELEFLAESAASQRVPLIVMGPADDPEAMRLAMRAGASDYVSQPLQHEELRAALDRIGEQLKGMASDRGQLITVMNSKGGSGASFIATNLAYALSQRKNTRPLLIDFDLQFGGLSRYLDLYPKRGIVEALDATEDMDEVSAEAYITAHKSGLRLLAAPTERLLLSRDVPVQQVDSLLQILQRNNDYLVADLPRRIDVLSATVLEHSDQVFMLVQQSLAAVHDAARMVQLLTKELAVPANRIKIILNRHSKNSLISIGDIKETLKVDHVSVIPNQYKLVTDSLNTGVPLMQSEKNSGTGKAIQRLASSVCGDKIEDSSPSILGRALPTFLGRN